MLVSARICCAATFATIFQRNGGFVAEYLPAACFAGALVLLYGAGVYLLTACEFPNMHASGRRSAIRLRKLTSASLIFLVVGSIYQVYGALTAPRPLGLMGAVSVEWYWTPLLLLFFGWIGYCLSIMAEFLFLANLADRLGDQFMRRSCIFIGIFAAVSSVLLMYRSQAIVMQGESLGAFGFVVLLWFLSLSCAGLINLDLAVRLATKASVSKAERCH